MFAARFQSALEKSWVSPNWLTLLLLPLSGFYTVVIQLRSWLYTVGLLRVYRAPVPVIVVGNLTVGGVGKTPLVIYLLQALKEHGYKPAVISRGYGGRAPNYPLLVTPTTSATLAGDEPVLIARRAAVPVSVGANRQQCIEQLLKHHDIDVVVSDDGLQHLALARDIEICVQGVEAAKPNRWLLPAGPYREPLSRLKRVDFVVRNGGLANAGESSMTLLASAPQALSLQATASLTFDPSRGVHAVAGIGNPQRFFQTCEDQGWRITRHPFPDHHPFSIDDIDYNDMPVIMTEKDAVKCREFADHRHWVLPVDVKLEPDIVSRLILNLQSHD